MSSLQTAGHYSDFTIPGHTLINTLNKQNSCGEGTAYFRTQKLHHGITQVTLQDLS